MIPLYDTLRSRRFPVINWFLIALNFIVFFYELSLSPSALNRLTLAWGLVPVKLMMHPETYWVTIFTSMFLHGGWFHILSNMWVLFIFGDNVEDCMGKSRYLIFYLLSGTAAGLLESYALKNSPIPSIGASGAIAGVLGAYLISFPRARIASLVPIIFIFTIIEIPAVIFLMFWFILQLFSGLFSLQGTSGSGIAWWAHVGGFLFGMLTVRLFARRQKHYLQQ
ncbi:MAG TPA: rhomboid family intramembrane serine protease [Anaerolineales bacterium]|nr:rhomboid family intramembrane serine protease [Anaerolineales bacterium]